MARICFALDDTLITTLPEELGGTDEPVEGAVEAMGELVQKGHELVVFTRRLRVAPDSEKQRMKEETEQMLQQLGFPPMEVWTGTVKPNADLFVGKDFITFDENWPMALSQIDVMLEDRGLAQEAQPFDQAGFDEQPGEQPEEQSPEEVPNAGSDET